MTHVTRGNIYYFQGHFLFYAIKKRNYYLHISGVNLKNL